MNFSFRSKTVSIAIIGLMMVASLRAQEANTQGSSSGNTKKVGGASAQFLKIGVGARANAMAGAFCGAANDVSALFYNPAGIVDISGSAGNISYGTWFGNYTHNFIGGVIPAGEKYRVGLSIVSLSSGDIPYTTLERGHSLGTFYSISDLAFGATFAGMLTQQFSFGVTVKYVNAGIASLNASTISVDMGTMYRFAGTRLGFSINNLGPQLKYTGTELDIKNRPVIGLNASELDATLSSNAFNLPLSFRAGMATDLLTEVFDMYQGSADWSGKETREHRWTIEGDFETYSDISDQFAVGTEYTWNDILSLRGGYRFGQDQFGVSGGVGVKYVGGGFDGAVDYSIQPTKTFGIVNRISIAVRLN